MKHFRVNMQKSEVVKWSPLKDEDEGLHCCNSQLLPPNSKAKDKMQEQGLTFGILLRELFTSNLV